MNGTAWPCRLLAAVLACVAVTGGAASVEAASAAMPSAAASVDAQASPALERATVPDFVSLYAELSPAVVTVRTLARGSARRRIPRSTGIGSGFFVGPDLVMTAAHVVGGADLIDVATSTGRHHPATIVSLVESSDVALLRLRGPVADAVTVRLGDAADAAIGEPVFVIGAPYGLEHTLGTGHLSGRSTRGTVVGGAPLTLLQTSTPINPGNSGGPLFNARGEVIGVVSFILSKGGGFDGVGFATAADVAYEALMDSSGFWAGFEGILLDATLTRALNLPAAGILVQRVVGGSVAERAGLVAGELEIEIEGRRAFLGGDVILAVNGLACVEPHDFRTLSAAVRRLRPELGYELTVFRAGETITLVVEAAETGVVP